MAGFCNSISSTNFSQKNSVSTGLSFAKIRCTSHWSELPVSLAYYVLRAELCCIASFQEEKRNSFLTNISTEARPKNVNKHLVAEEI